MQVTYHLNETEIGPAFLDSLKAAFRGQTLKISIEAEGTAAPDVLAHKIANGLTADHAYRLSYDEMAQLADDLDAGKAVNPVVVFQTHRADR